MPISYPILLVEDEPVSAFVSQEILQGFDFRVTAVDDGVQALAALEREFYPIIVLDLMMPVMDGICFCKTVRAKAIQSYIYIIIVSAVSEKNKIVEALEAGADDYLTKPFDPFELKARLKSAIRIL